MNAIEQYINDCRAAGHSDAVIAEALLDAGTSRRDVDAALARVNMNGHAHDITGAGGTSIYLATEVITMASIEAEISQIVSNITWVNEIKPLLAKIAQLRPDTGDLAKLIKMIDERELRGATLGELRRMYGEAEAAYHNSLKGTNWRSRLIKNEITRRPLNLEFNTLEALTCHEGLQGVLIWDEFYGDAFIVRRPPWLTDDRAWKSGAFSDDDAVGLAAFLQHTAQMPTTSEMIWKCVALVAKKNSIDSMRDAFDGLEWDGVERDETMLIDFCGAEDTPFNRAVSTKWMVGVVARQFQPGAKMDNVLTLEGAQDLMKTMFFETLAGGEDFFHEFVGDIHNRDDMMPVRGKIIVEMAEGVSQKRADRDKYKAGVSARADDHRDPYVRKNAKRPRRFGWAYTGNDYEYLNDPTGARRTWPVRVTKIDIVGLRRSLKQLWAEAVWRYKQHVDLLARGEVIEGSVAATGYHWWIDGAVDLELKNEQKLVALERQERHPWRSAIESWLIHLGEVREGKFFATGARPDGQLVYIKNAETVLQGAIGMDLERMTKTHRGIVADILRELGYESKGVWPPGDRKIVKRVHGYWLEKEAHQHPSVALMLRH